MWCSFYFYENWKVLTILPLKESLNPSWPNDCSLKLESSPSNFSIIHQMCKFCLQKNAIARVNYAIIPCLSLALLPYSTCTMQIMFILQRIKSIMILWYVQWCAHSSLINPNKGIEFFIIVIQNIIISKIYSQSDSVNKFRRQVDRFFFFHSTFSFLTKINI